MLTIAAFIVLKISVLHRKQRGMQYATKKSIVNSTRVISSNTTFCMALLYIKVIAPQCVIYIDSVRPVSSSHAIVHHTIMSE